MATEYEQLDALAAEAWRPEKDGKLIGVVVDIDTRDSDYGPDYTVITVQPDGDEPPQAWHAFHKVARNEVARKKPQIGDRIGIKLIGVAAKATKPGYSPATLWKLAIFQRGEYGKIVEAAMAAAAAPAPTGVGDARPAGVQAADAELRAKVPTVELPTQPASVPPQQPVAEAAVSLPAEAVAAKELADLKLKVQQMEAAAATHTPVSPSEGVTIANEATF